MSNRANIIFASRNQGKIREVRQILSEGYKVLSLDDIDFWDEIPEPHSTIRENAIHKAKFFFKMTNIPCIAEDSGLEVDALNGEPSAYSARYAGADRDDVKNYERVLKKLEGKTNRAAKFISVLVYKDKSNIEIFKGTMNGNIIDEPRGENGFGYDPIFVADGNQKTNAEISPEEKNKISHRRKALDQFILFLKNKN